MQISVQIVVQTEVDEQASVTEIAHFELPISNGKISRPAHSACILRRRRRCWAGCSAR